MQFLFRCRVLGTVNPDPEADPDPQDPGHDHGIGVEIVIRKIDKNGVKGRKALTGM